MFCYHIQLHEERPWNNLNKLIRLLHVKSSSAFSNHTIKAVKWIVFLGNNEKNLELPNSVWSHMNPCLVIRTETLLGGSWNSSIWQAFSPYPTHGTLMQSHLIHSASASGNTSGERNMKIYIEWLASKKGEDTAARLPSSYRIIRWSHLTHKHITHDPS
jgi:hypothetical protein